MLYCHLCQASAFVKASFGETQSLDCGHVVRVKKGSGAVSTPESQAYVVTKVPEKKAKAVKKREAETVIAPPTFTPRPAHAWRTYPRTANVAQTVVDLLKGDKK